MIVSATGSILALKYLDGPSQNKTEKINPPTETKREPRKIVASGRWRNYGIKNRIKREFNGSVVHDTDIILLSINGRPFLISIHHVLSPAKEKGFIAEATDGSTCEVGTIILGDDNFAWEKAKEQGLELAHSLIKLDAQWEELGKELEQELADARK
jgi:hypothetical protein